MSSDFLARLSSLIVHTFFREIVVEGKERLPKGIPVIFAANHPNALLDPLLLQLFSPEYRVRFVAKNTLFKVPVFGSLLRKAAAIPVVRRMDADGTVDYTQFFSSCLEALKQGDSIGIFPEGRSLPQPYISPLRTGTARLFFMARQSGVHLALIPIGLNYESGAIFRSSVSISVAPPLDTTRYEQLYTSDPVSAVRDLTDALADALEDNVFQTQNFRDRELMMLLERLYHHQETDDSWSDRLGRLKEFEVALARLRDRRPAEIARLRSLLARYQRLSRLYGLDPNHAKKQKGSEVWTFIASAAGMVLAGIGSLFNWIPYRLCALLVQITRKDESEAATFKVVYSIFLFPITYVLEGLILRRFLGWPAVIAFAALILPLTYFTLHFFEWHEETRRDLPRPSYWFAGALGRVSGQLQRLRARIIREVETLAAELSTTETTKTTEN